MSGTQPPPADQKAPEDDDTVRKLIQLTFHPAVTVLESKAKLTDHEFQIASGFDK